MLSGGRSGKRKAFDLGGEDGGRGGTRRTSQPPCLQDHSNDQQDTWWEETKGIII